MSKTLDQALKPLEAEGSIPIEGETFAVEDELAHQRMDESSKEIRKRKQSSSKEQRDNEKQLRREERRGSQGPSPQETGRDKPS